MQGITKRYPNGVLANNQVHFSVKKGEIHALVGENGAGKSTLMKILYGVEQPDAGEIWFDGENRIIRSAADAIGLGIGMVYQHFKLIGPMSVAQNIVLGSEPVRHGLYDFDAARKTAAELIERYRFPVGVNDLVDNLTVGQKQKVEILKVLHRNAKLLILDEPTAVLTPQETKEFFAQLRLLKETGHTVIFISHKIHEIQTVCDRVTVLRGAKTIDTYEVGAVSAQEISDAIIGYELKPMVNRAPPQKGEVLLRAEKLCATDGQGRQILHDISFSLRAGTILGVVGVEGNGQAPLVHTVIGRRRASSGTLELHGRPVDGQNLRLLRKQGLAYIPEDRMHDGLAPGLSIEENMVADKYREPAYSGRFLLRQRHISKVAREMIGRFQVNCRNEKQPIGMLSGGNMQKVIAAREFSAKPTLMVAEQPTRGIDVGAARLIHESCLKMRGEGGAVLLVSADIGEVLAVSDEIIVMFNGKIAARFNEVAALSEAELGLYMLGVKTQDAEGVKGDDLS